MKKTIAWVLILTLLFSLVGCKRAGDEQGATNGEYIEGNGQQGSGDAPEKVTDWELIDPSGSVGKPQTPSDQQEQEQPDEQQQNEQQKPTDQPEKEEEPSKPEQKPQEVPDQEEEPDQPVTNPEEQPTEQPDNQPEVDYIEDPEDLEEEEEDFEEETPEEDYEEDEDDSEDDYVTPTPSRPSTPSVNTPTNPVNNQLKIISYNVRCKSDGEGKTISQRSVRFKKVMDQYDPDIMGLQEVVPEWLTYLERDFSSTYSYINKWRASNSKESTPIFWKKDRFTLVESGHFWLSETPDKESKATSWGAKHYRVCMWVKLKIKATGKTFLFFNTHFDTVASARVPSAKLVVERAMGMGGFTQFPIFCTGDFNMKPDTTEYNEMCKSFKDINRVLSNSQTPTYTSYQTKTGSIIDYCFFSSDKITPIKYQVVEEFVDNGYVSDHSGLYIEAKLL